jgi:4-amino-4-deoxy-L-arabinose transferase-like glycosyltransferase
VEALDPSPRTPAVRDPEPPSRLLREAALIGLLALTLNLAGNGRISLWDRDEPRYAGCTREMRESGDWIHPTFNAEGRYHKPILIYWLMLAGTWVGGDNPFGARLISSIAGAGTCLLVWGLGRRMFGPRAGLLAALVLATAPMMVIESKLATTDATLTLFLVGCQFALWELSKAPSRVAATAFWLCLAMATLTKGPIGPVLIAVSAAVSWWWGGPVDCWKRLHWRWGLAAFVLITAPWYIAIGIITHGEFFRVSMGYHVVRRMTTGIETHGGFPGYYAALSQVAFYPWAALLPAGLLGAWLRRRKSPAYGFVLGWIVGPLIFLECVQTKIIHYYLPSYPAWGLLVGWMVVAVAEAEVNLRRWPMGRLSLALLAGIGIALTVSLLAGTLVLPGSLRWPCLALAVVVVGGTLFAMERFQAGDVVKAAHGLVGAWAVVMFLIGVWALPAADPFRLSPMVARGMKAISVKEHATPMLATYKAPGIVYGLGHPAAEMDGRENLVDRLSRDGAVVTALSEKEIALLASDSRMSLDVRDPIRGFNVERFKNESLKMVVIRPSGSSLAGRPEPSQIK